MDCGIQQVLYKPRVARQTSTSIGRGGHLFGRSPSSGMSLSSQRGKLKLKNEMHINDVISGVWFHTRH